MIHEKIAATFRRTAADLNVRAGIEQARAYDLCAVGMISEYELEAASNQAMAAEAVAAALNISLSEQFQILQGETGYLVGEAVNVMDHTTLSPEEVLHALLPAIAKQTAATNSSTLS